MEGAVNIRSALISVYHKKGLETIISELELRDVRVYSTGGTAAYLRDAGIRVVEIEELTGYPSILGGRVKTLHPGVHGGILARRGIAADEAELIEYGIPTIDLVIVDLYPFEETVQSKASEAEIIEKIDIGGIALIRGAAKNFEYVTCIASQESYGELADMLRDQDGHISLAQRKALAARAFDISSHYDTHIHRYLSADVQSFKLSLRERHELRYGENPHQKGYFFGKLGEQFEQLHGKALSYNNLVDIDAAMQLVDEFDDPFFAVIKHCNPCGCALASDLSEAWDKALAGDPVSAFGGILACNGKIEAEVAAKMNELFFEVLVARDFSDEALGILTSKKNRILLRRLPQPQEGVSSKSALNGYIVQERDLRSAQPEDLRIMSTRRPTDSERADALFGEKVCKHLKSNAIALVRDRQLIGSGVGQTSRIDALQQAIAKAKKHGFATEGSVLISDAFFPFSDSVETAHAHGIGVVLQPGGSRRDDESINYCESNSMCLIFTGLRHFRH